MTVALACFVLTASFLYAGWTLISDAARGERWITLSRKSNEAPEALRKRLEEAWKKTALTFEPVRILPESTDTVKTFTLQVEEREFRTTLKRLPAAEADDLILTCVAANGQPFPLGRDHRKIWRVEPRGKGSIVHVAVTFKAPPGAIVQAIFTFRKQLQIVASL